MLGHAAIVIRAWHEGSPTSRYQPHGTIPLHTDPASKLFGSTS